jgi:peptidoglycan/xylan/chitin deacetylase (PgdA/CDA1 family)
MSLLVAVNFHYIQPEGRYPYPGIHPTPVDELESQLGALGESFQFISGDDLVQAVTEGKSLPENACLITFDDGLREQYENAAPVLDRCGVSGVFFICAQPIIDRIGLTVHKMHRLRATRSPEIFLMQLQEVAGEIGIDLSLQAVDQDAADQQYLYDDPETRRLKFLLNHMISFDEHEKLIQAVFAREWDEAGFCEEMYMNPDQIRDLGERHTVGSHSYTHSPLAQFEYKRLVENFTHAKSALSTILKKEVFLVSYPYGGPSAVSPAVSEAAAEGGFVAGFTMERSVNSTLAQPLLLARVSTNDAPGGKSPLMVDRGDGTGFEYIPPMQPSRSLYFDESAASLPAALPRHASTEDA